MLITNGKKIIIQDNNLDNLEKIMNDVTRQAREQFGNDKIKFKFVDEPNFPHYANVDDLTFDQLRECCIELGVDIRMRAFGNEAITVPGTSHKEIKHVFTNEEKAAIADEIVQKVKDKEEMEDNKKQVVKQLTDQITIVDTQISDKSSTYREGYELRTMKVKTMYDFEAGYKMFLDPNTGDCLQSEKLEGKDFQLRMDYDQQFQEASQDDEIASATDSTEEPKAEDTEGKKKKGKGGSKKKTDKPSKKKKGKEDKNTAAETKPAGSDTEEDAEELPLGGTKEEDEDENSEFFEED